MSEPKIAIPLALAQRLNDLLDGKWTYDSYGGCRYCGDPLSLEHRCELVQIECELDDLLSRAQPAPGEWQPIKPGLALDAAKHLTKWMRMALCDCEVGQYCDGYSEVKRARDALLKVAEQQPTPWAEAWQSADNPPESEPGTWSREVIAVTLSGDVFRIAYMGTAADGAWQRTTAMAELGDGGEVVAWIDSPEALIAAHSAGNAARQTGENE